MTNIEFTDKEQVFESIYFGNFATPKKLNRSNKPIPQQYIDSIESGEVNSDMIKEISKIVPVFVYKTCITIHGNLPDIQRQTVGGYKNLIQNKNNSLEIRYSAIDHQIKQQLHKYIQSDWSKQCDSTKGIYFVKTQRAQEKETAYKILKEQKDFIQKLQFTGMKAKIFVSGYSYFGMYYISITICPLLIESDPVLIAHELTGKPIEVLKEEEQQRVKEDGDRAKQYELDRIRRQQQADEQKQVQANFEQQIKDKYKPSPITAGAIFVYSVILANGQPAYKFIQTEKGTFGRVKYKFYNSNTLEFNPEKLQEAMKGKQVKPTEITRQQTYKYI